MTNALMHRASVTVANTRENCPGGKDLRWPTVSVFPARGLPAFLFPGLWKENMWQKKTPPTLQGCLGYREMRKGETSALWVCTNHLISSHLASTPQNSTPICHWFVIRPLWVNIGVVFYLTRASQGPNWMKLLLFSVKMHHENFIREASWEAGKGLQNYPHINWFIYAFCMFARGGANMWRTKINIRGLFLSFHTVTPAAKGKSSDMAASPFPTEKSHRTQLRKTETTSLMVTLWPWGPHSLQVMFTQ